MKIHIVFNKECLDYHGYANHLRVKVLQKINILSINEERLLRYGILTGEVDESLEEVINALSAITMIESIKIDGEVGILDETVRLY